MTDPIYKCKICGYEGDLWEVIDDVCENCHIKNTAEAKTLGEYR